MAVESSDTLGSLHKSLRHYLRTLRGIDEPEHYGSAADGAVGAVDPDLLYPVCGVAQTGSVDEPEEDTLDLASVFNQVACRAGNIAHYRLVVIKKMVEQRRFPGIGMSGYRHRHTLLESLAGGITSYKSVDYGEGLIGYVDELSAVGKGYILL